QVDRSCQPQRQRNEGRDQRRHERTHDERHDAELLLGALEEGCPGGSEEKLPNRDLTEEVDGFPQQDRNDSHRRGDRHERACDQDPPDDVLRTLSVFLATEVQGWPLDPSRWGCGGTRHSTPPDCERIAKWPYASGPSGPDALTLDEPSLGGRTRLWRFLTEGLAVRRDGSIDRAGDLVHCLLLRVVRQGNIPDRRSDLVRRRGVELDELLDLRALLELVGVDVDVERAAQRLVGAVRDGLDARANGAGAGIDRDRLQRVLVLFVVGEAEVAEGIRAAGDALDQHVVDLARGVVGADLTILAEDLLVEVVGGSGGRARTVQLDRLLREVGSNVRPVRDTTVGSPDAGELVDGQVLDEVVLGRDDNRDA